MNTRPVPLLLFALLLIILGFYGFLVLIPRGSAPQSGVRGEAGPAAPSSVTFVDPVRGDPEGKVTVIEYGDFACDACRAAEPAVQELLATTPGVRFVWRDFPIERGFPSARRAAIAARCAQDQGKFWEYHDLLLSRADVQFDPALLELAARAGLEGERFAVCLEGEERGPLVDRFQEEAVSLGAPGAPTFFINGVRYDGPVSGLSAAVGAAKGR